MFNAAVSNPPTKRPSGKPNTTPIMVSTIISRFT